MPKGYLTFTGVKAIFRENPTPAQKDFRNLCEKTTAQLENVWMHSCNKKQDEEPSWWNWLLYPRFFCQLE